MNDPDEIVNYHQGCRLRWALCQSIEPYGQVAQPGTRTYAANANVSTSPLTEPLGHRDTRCHSVLVYVNIHVKMCWELPCLQKFGQPPRVVL